MQQEIAVVEAAKIAGRSQRTIRRWIERGKLKARQVTPFVNLKSIPNEVNLGFCE